MANPLKKVWEVVSFPFRKIGELVKSPKVKIAFGWVDDLFEEAIPFVKLVAAATPNKFDDGFVAAVEAFYRKHEIAVNGFLELAPEKRGDALANVATELLIRKFPEADWTAARAAVELAFLKVKTEQ